MNDLLNKIVTKLDIISNRLDQIESRELRTYTSEEICKILQISDKKLKSLRKERKIGFSQDGQNIRYTAYDILEYLLTHRTAPKGKLCAMPQQNNNAA